MAPLGRPFTAVSPAVTERTGRNEIPSELQLAAVSLNGSSGDDSLDDGTGAIHTSGKTGGTRNAVVKVESPDTIQRLMTSNPHICRLPIEID
jgi:hypothetical protein